VVTEIFSMMLSKQAFNPSDAEGMYDEVPEAMVSLSNQPFILGIDDNQDDLLLLSYTVGFCNVEFIGQTSGLAALKLVTSSPPTLILLDILLSDLNGVDFLNRLKQNPLTSNIPVIAVTALATLSDRTWLLSAGFVDYVSKPYMLEDLEAAILRHLKAGLEQGE
jgi:CheY-like chemotaxis protein